MSPDDLFREALASTHTLVLLNTPELRRAFQALPEYSWTRPTSVVDGKVWRGQVAQGEWWLHGDVPHSPGHSQHVSHPVCLLPDGAEVRLLDGQVHLSVEGRRFWYGPRANSLVVQGDAWAVAAGVA